MKKPVSRKTSGTVMLLAGLLAGPALYAEKQQEIQAPIISVIAYPDRALITRQTSIKLTEGRHTLVFKSASPNLNADSLRAFANHADIVVRGVHSYLERRSYTVHPKLRQLEAEIQQLQKHIDQKRLALKRVNAEMDGLADYRDYLKTTISQNSVEKSESQDWNPAMEYLGHRRRTALLNKQHIDQQIDQIQRKLGLKQKERDKLWYAGRKLVRVIEIHLQAKKAAQSIVGFSYMMKGAAWNVSYGMHYKGDQVYVEYYGNIQQQTGEDWQNVQLILSTARPATGAARPRIQALAMDARETKSVQEFRQAEEGASGVSDGESIQPSEGAADTGGFAQLESSGNSIMFRIPRKYTVSSSERSFRVKIAGYNLKTKDTMYRIVGYRQDMAYLTTRLQNNRPFPMLAGTVDIYRNAGFSGRSQIRHTPPGGSFLLNLGSDQKIHLERQVHHKRETSGLMQSGRVYQTSIKNSIENRSAETLQIELFERLPVSETEDVQIKLLDDSDSGFKESKSIPGVMRYLLKLQPGQSRIIQFGFRAQVPDNFPGTLYGN